jgi:UDP-2,3-diacylglucosamine pyrophosphatase LpxH
MSTTTQNPQVMTQKPKRGRPAKQQHHVAMIPSQPLEIKIQRGSELSFSESLFIPMKIGKFVRYYFAGIISDKEASEFSRLYNKIRKLFKLPYHSLANTIKQSVKGAINFVSDFEENAKGLTKQKECDVAVCGHIHQPKLEIDYMNSGDFCENSTCLVEDFDGKWYIIKN